MATANTGHTTLLVDTLKKLLRARGMTYRDLGKALGKSEASIKRLFAKEALTLKRLEEICSCLEVDIFELATVARSQSAQSQEMTVEQEAALAADARLLGVFYLVLNDWRLPDILDRYEIEKAEAIALLSKLEHLDLIRLLPGDRIRLLIPRTMRLRNDGPIRRVHGNRVIGEFVAGDFVSAGGMFRMELRELSEPSYALIQRKLERICQEFNELAELDSYLPSDKRKTVGLAAGTKPWTMSLVSGIKYRDAPAAAEGKPKRTTPV
ncbi:MAG TPA: helix-turn-helix transcriptional regulator [Usitatibacteraceae bacterium]|nr:helix-turn-helix transcriptional regulator [Usitatibacteraceae bacterium]